MADDILNEAKKNTALLTEMKSKQAEDREKKDTKEKTDLK
jgi:hypothetical protein